jgi:hypothetical protein
MEVSGQLHALSTLPPEVANRKIPSPCKKSILSCPAHRMVAILTKLFQLFSEEHEILKKNPKINFNDCPAIA